MGNWDDWESQRPRRSCRVKGPPVVEVPPASAPVAIAPVPAPKAGPEAGAGGEPPAATQPGSPGRRRRRSRKNLTETRALDRVQRVFFVGVRGRHGTYRSLVSNLSRTGVLLTIVDPAFAVEDCEGNVEVATLRIAAQFSDGLAIVVNEIAEPIEAEIVRVEEERHEGEVFFSLGCRFRRPLSDDESRALRLPPLPKPEVPETPAEVPAATEAAPAVETAPSPAPSPSDAVAAAAAAAQAAAAAAAALAGSPSRAQGFRVECPPAKPGTVYPSRVTVEGAPRTIEDLFRIAVDRGATDLHLKGGSPIRLRVDGELVELEPRTPLGTNEAIGLVRSLLTHEQNARFEERGDLDIAVSVEGAARFRVNVLRARGEVGLAVRRIPEKIPTPKELGIASACVALAERPRGLVLVTGPTGSGKSTTLASMIHHVNETRRCHILTMEDPIEYLHSEIQAHITQREVGRDTTDFAAALKRALRQDPNVILVGEMRDLETISLAVTAAETGHLVFATLHTTSAVLSVDRIVDVFPPEQQRQARMQLADCLQGIVSQLLIPKIGGGVVVAQEILMASTGVRSLIREGKSPQIGNMMQTGAREGMQTLEDALNDLLHRGLVTYDAALAKANHPRLIERGGKPLVRQPAAAAPGTPAAGR